MRLLTLTVATLPFAMACGGSGSSRCEATVVVTSAADWDSIRGCAEIAGDLTIRTTESPSLTAGASIRSIRGHLLVSGNAELTTLTLPVLTSVSGGLTIQNNAKLSALALPLLAEVAGDLTVLHNRPGAWFQLGLPALTTVGGTLFLGSDPQGSGFYLLDLGALTTVNGDVVIESAAPFGLSLPSLSAVHGDLTYAPVSGVISTAVPALVSVGGTLRLLRAGQAAMPSLAQVGNLEVVGDGSAGVGLRLPGLTAVHGRLEVSDVDEVSLPALTSVGDLSVWGRSVRRLELSSLVDDGGRLWVSVTGLQALAFPSLAHVAGPVGILSNPALETLRFPQLSIANSRETNPNAYGGNGFEVTSNHALTTLEVPALVAVGGDTNLFDDGLTALDLPAYTTGHLNVSGNPALTSLSAPAFQGNALTVTSNPALTSVDFAGLRSLFSLTVSDDPSLASLDFPSLVSTSGLHASRNPGLTSLTAASLRTVGFALEVTDNAALPQCQVMALLAQLVDFTGTATISGNGENAGCLP